MLSNQEIIIIIMICLIFYLLYKTHSTPEHFSVSNDVKQAINDVYKADINAIRNLSNFATELINNNDSLTIPAQTTNVTDLVTTGNLIVNGNISFTNKNTTMMEILPTGMVIAWALSTLPKGWALCDGNKYKLNNDGSVRLDSDGIQTPDLRGRFVLGSNPTQFTDSKNNIISVRNLNVMDGEENHKLLLSEIPSHNHKIVLGNGGHPANGWNAAIVTDRVHQNNENIIKNEGGVLREGTGVNNIPAIYDTTPHNNMPPFYVLTYIMKL
jgi:microcystin-dependent protein